MNHTKNLDGEWTLHFLTERAAVPKTPAELEARGDKNTIPAQVPGNVEIDLERAGILPDVFVGLNALKTRRYEYCSFYYETEFKTPEWAVDSDIELVFDGIDCFADVYLNGEKIGSCDNALISHRFSVCLAGRGKENHLWIHLHSALNMAKKYEIPADCSGGRPERFFVRKPAHSYGWDILPRLVSAGLWRSVRLEAVPVNAIENFYCYTSELADDLSSAELSFDLKFRCEQGMCRSDDSESDWWENIDENWPGVNVIVTGECGDSTFHKEVPVYFTSVRFAIAVEQPRLWWPHGYGEPNLYRIHVRIMCSGKCLAEKSLAVGIRQIHLDKTDAAENGRFHFIVNHTEVFVRGFNHVGLDALHSRDESRLDAFFELAAPLESNMVRCWGGSVYDCDSFFDRCDRAGLMVWQDFALACSYHPRTAEFLARLRIEFTCVVKRLRNHASLALWCGDNEVDMFVVDRGKSFGLSPLENTITRQLLPELLRQFDPARAYLASSPEYNAAALASQDPAHYVPEQHLWGARSFFRSDYYTKTNAVFISEIGHHGCPDVSSIRRFITPDKLWPWQDNKEWWLHSTSALPESWSGSRINLMAEQMVNYFGFCPEELPIYAKMSQIVQAEAYKLFIELMRQRKGQTGGILWWNLLDGWPQFADSVADYYFCPKLAYYYIRRSQAPLAMMLCEPNNVGELELVAVNDGRVKCTGTYCVIDADSGAILMSGHFSVDNDHIFSGGKFVPPEGDKLFLIRYATTDGRTGVNHYLSGKAPYDFEYYLKHFSAIAGMDGSFDAGNIGQ